MLITHIYGAIFLATNKSMTHSIKYVNKYTFLIFPFDPPPPPGGERGKEEGEVEEGPKFQVKLLSPTIIELQTM